MIESGNELSDVRCTVAVLASGHGTNFRAIAQACAADGFPARVACLISDRPAAPAVDVAHELGIATHVVEPPSSKARLPVGVETEMADICARYHTDLIALAGFMRILSGPLLDRFDGRIMNIHPSLLPSFKGLNAIGQALEYGARITGCTVHFVDRTVDGGAIILQAPVEVRDNDDEARLAERIHDQEHRAYVRAVELFALGKLERRGRRVRIAD